MRRATAERLILAAVLIILGCLAAGCSSATKSAISSLPSKAASALPSRPPASPTAPAEPTTEAAHHGAPDA